MAKREKHSASQPGGRRAKVNIEEVKKPKPRGRAGAFSLFGCYLIASFLWIIGIIEGFKLIIGDVQTDDVNNGNGLILGFTVIVLSLAFILGLGYVAHRLWRHIKIGSLREVQHFSFISIFLSVGGLLIIFIKYGATVLSTVAVGGIALFLILFAFTSLLTFANARSTSE